MDRVPKFEFTQKEEEPKVLPQRVPQGYRSGQSGRRIDADEERDLREDELEESYHRSRNYQHYYDPRCDPDPIKRIQIAHRRWQLTATDWVILLGIVVFIFVFLLIALMIILLTPGGISRMLDVS